MTKHPRAANRRLKFVEIKVSNHTNITKFY